MISLSCWHALVACRSVGAALVSFITRFITTISLGSCKDDEMRQSLIPGNREIP
jgi:hypothetical protein